MGQDYNPDDEANLTPVTLKDLATSDRIIYMDPDVGPHRENLVKVGKDLTFYVDRKTHLALPLRMQLYQNDRALIPNQPVAALRFRQDGFCAVLPKFHEMGVIFPFSWEYEFDNRRVTPGGDDLPYFEPSESGWKRNDQGRPLEARTGVEFDTDGRATTATTIVRFQL